MNAMTKLTSGLFFGAAMTVSSLASAADLSGVPAGKYEVDSTHAYINFQYNHLGFSNPTLSFDEFSVSMDLNNEDPTKSSVAVSINADSVITGSTIFHQHITGGKWLDTSTYPTIDFKSTGIEENADGTYTVTGDLTVKDVTKPTSLMVTINGAKNHPMSGNPVVGLDASGDLLRSDYGVGAFAPNVSDELALNISVEMVKAN